MLEGVWGGHNGRWRAVQAFEDKRTSVGKGTGEMVVEEALKSVDYMSNIYANARPGAMKRDVMNHKVSCTSLAMLPKMPFPMSPLRSTNSAQGLFRGVTATFEGAARPAEGLKCSCNTVSMIGHKLWTDVAYSGPSLGESGWIHRRPGKCPSWRRRQGRRGYYMHISMRLENAMPAVKHTPWAG